MNPNLCCVQKASCEEPLQHACRAAPSYISQPVSVSPICSASVTVWQLRSRLVAESQTPGIQVAGCCPTPDQLQPVCLEGFHLCSQAAQHSAGLLWNVAVYTVALQHLPARASILSMSLQS